MPQVSDDLYHIMLPYIILYHTTVVATKVSVFGWPCNRGDSMDRLDCKCFVHLRHVCKT